MLLISFMMVVPLWIGEKASYVINVYDGTTYISVISS